MNNFYDQNFAFLQCELDGRVLSTVQAVDNTDTGDFAEVAYETVSGEPVTAHMSNSLPQES